MSKIFIIDIRDQDVGVFRICSTNIMNIDDSTTVYSLLFTLVHEKACRHLLTLWAAQSCSFFL